MQLFVFMQIIAYFCSPKRINIQYMSIKTQRLDAIRQIISKNGVKNQDEVLNGLQVMGFAVTQATLSRDFKEIGVIKVHDPKRGYFYKLSGQAGIGPARVSNHIALNGIRSIEFSNSFAVIKTQPGFAGAVASIIDNNSVHEIVGTIAGDDTVLMVIREGYSRDQVLDSVSSFISGIQFKLK